MFSYRALFRQAWEISWRHKYLWFFGLFASLVAGSGSWEYQIMTQNMNQGLVNGSYAGLAYITTIGDALSGFALGLINIFHYDVWTIMNILSLLIISAAFIIFFLWLAIASQAALVSSTKQLLELKKKGPALTIRAGLTEGHRYFWPLLALNLLIRALIAFAFEIPLVIARVGDGQRHALHGFAQDFGLAYQIVDDLIECGVSVHDPQIRANTIEGIRKAYKGRMCVNLDLDRQMFMFCKADDIRQQVKDSVNALDSPEGGLMIYAAFCDNVTPLEIIEKRLDAIFALGIPVVLYNPKSRGRPHNFALAVEHARNHLGKDTPIAIVKNALREDEAKIITTLGEIEEHVAAIDMHTTVIIGGSESRIWRRGDDVKGIITPRGYHRKYVY